MKTPSAKAHEVERKWWIVDAEDVVLGRAATEIARVLRGKHKPIYTPHVDTGDFVVVINAEKVRFTGNKETAKEYFRYTGFPGGGKTTTVERQRASHPDRVVTSAVKGMLPKGPLGRKMLKKLKVYSGSAHPHAAQKPEALKL
jgi:large subunit ribosomal protein L13